MVDILLEDGVLIDEVGLEILLEDLDILGLSESLEGDSFSLYVGGDVGKEEVAPALIE